MWRLKRGKVTFVLEWNLNFFLLNRISPSMFSMAPWWFRDWGTGNREPGTIRKVNINEIVLYSNIFLLIKLFLSVYSVVKEVFVLPFTFSNLFKFSVLHIFRWSQCFCGLIYLWALSGSDFSKYSKDFDVVSTREHVDGDDLLHFKVTG